MILSDLLNKNFYIILYSSNETPAKIFFTKDVEDIDLFVGGFMEAIHLDSMIGPVFKCIIGDQFARLKKGDRFFYDLSPNQASVTSSFTAAQECIHT